MSDDILKTLGLEPEADEHPADVETLKKLGLKPESDERPRMLGARPLEPWETTPGAAAPAGTNNTQPNTRLGRIHAALNPATALPAIASNVGSNIADYFNAGAGQFSRGMGQLFNNQPASGVGNVAMGGAGASMSPLTGTVKSGEDALANLTGNPDFADKAALMVPFKVGGPVAKTATSAIAPSTKAYEAIAERMTPEALERMKNNPRLRPMDVSKGVRDIATGFAKDTSNPAAQAPIVRSMENSAATAKDAVRGTYDEAMGPPPNVYEEYQRLQQQAQTVGRSKIQPALDAGKPVDTSGVLAKMDEVLKPGVQSVANPGVPFQTRLQSELSEWRNELMQDGSQLTDPNRLHEVQSDLRRYADDLQKSPDGQSKRLGRQLMNFRGQLVDAIDKSAPGYKDALSDYKDAKDISSAFDFGRTLTKNTGDIETDPSYWEQWVKDKNRSPEELEAAKLGARQAVEQKMGSIKSSALDPGRSGTDVPQVDFNRRKLELLFGKDATEQMFRHLQDERDIAVSNNRGLANSTTAEATAAQKAFQPRDISQPHSNLPGWAMALGIGAGAVTNPTLGAITGGSLLAARGAKSGYDWLARQGEIARNAHMGNLVTRNDPEAIRRLTAAMDRVNRRNKLGNLLAPP